MLGMLATAFAGDLVLVRGEVDLPTVLVEAGWPATPSQPWSAVTLPGGSPIWLARGGTTTLCAGAQQKQARIVELVKEGVSRLNYGEETEARKALSDAEALLACADERVTPETLWDLYFFGGVLAGSAGDASEAVRMFRAAGLARPKGTWDDNYPPDIQSLYVKGREAVAAAEQVTLTLEDPGGSLKAAWIDGREVDLGKPVIVALDQHLLQVETTLGQTLSMRVDMKEEGVALTPSAVPDVLSRGDDPVTVELIETLKADRVLVVDGVQRRAFAYTDTGVAPVRLPVPEEPPERGAIAPVHVAGLATVSAWADQPDSTTWVGATPRLQVRIVGALTLDAAFTTSFASAPGGVYILPFTRLGARGVFGVGDSTRLSFGAAGSFAPHDLGVRAGAGGIFGLGQRIADDLFFEVDLHLGTHVTGTTQLSLGIGYAL